MIKKILFSVSLLTALQCGNSYAKKSCSSSDGFKNCSFYSTCRECSVKSQGHDKLACCYSCKDKKGNYVNTWDHNNEAISQCVVAETPGNMLADVINDEGTLRAILIQKPPGVK